MNPVDIAILRRKLATIVEALEALRPLARLGLEEYRRRLYERKAVERLLQETIEAAIDINAHIASERAAVVPDDAHGGFLVLAHLGILSVDLAERLAPSAGLRNRIVHQYDRLDDALVYASIERVLDLYLRYVEAIEAYAAVTERSPT